MPTKTALITGAAGGLGGCSAAYLAARNWTVFAAALPQAIERQAPSEGVVLLPMDVTDGASVAKALETVRGQVVGLDAVVNCAGILAVGSLIELPLETVQRVVDVNLWGTYRVNQAFFPLLRARQGRIVNMSSETGWQSGAPFNGIYALSKHAVEAYSDSLRRELMLLGIKVIKVQPGPFKTNMVSSIDASFRRAIDDSTLFKVVLDRVRQLAMGEEGKASDPVVLAATVYEALTATNPKPAYSLRPDLARSALEYLPTRWADRLLQRVLSTARPKA